MGMFKRERDEAVGGQSGGGEARAQTPQEASLPWEQAWQEWDQAWSEPIEQGARAREALIARAVDDDDPQQLSRWIDASPEGLGAQTRRDALERALRGKSARCALMLARDRLTPTGPKGSSPRGLLSLAVESGDLASFEALLDRCDVAERDDDEPRSWPLWKAMTLEGGWEPWRVRMVQALAKRTPQGMLTAANTSALSRAIFHGGAEVVPALLEATVAQSEPERSFYFWAACGLQDAKLASMVLAWAGDPQPWRLGFLDDEDALDDALARACRHGSSACAALILARWAPQAWPAARSNQSDPVKWALTRALGEDEDGSGRACLQALRDGGWLGAWARRSLRAIVGLSGELADQLWRELMALGEDSTHEGDEAWEEVLKAAARCGQGERAREVAMRVPRALRRQALLDAMNQAKDGASKNWGVFSNFISWAAPLLGEPARKEATRWAWWAVKKGVDSQVEAVGEMLPWVDREWLDESGCDLGMRALQEGHFNLAKLFLPTTDLSRPNQWGFVGLELAAMEKTNALDMMELALEHGAKPGRGGFCRRSALMLMLEEKISSKEAERAARMALRLASLGGQLEPCSDGRVPEDFFTSRTPQEVRDALARARELYGPPKEQFAR